MSIEDDIKRVTEKLLVVRCHSCQVRAVADADDIPVYTIIDEYEPGIARNWSTPYIKAHICEDCIGDTYIILDSGEAIESSRAVCTYDGEIVMDDDAITCDDCCNVYLNENTQYLDYTERSICNSCMENGDYVWIDGGYELRHIDDAYYCDDCDDWYSPDHGEHCNSRGPLLPYDADIFHHIEYRAMVKGAWLSRFNKKLVFGVELETDSRSDDAEDIAQHLFDSTNYSQFGICKSDGTVSGPELVTLPADLHSHQNDYSWSKWCEELRGIAKGHHADSAGIHVHINRGAVSALTLGKMLVFVNGDDNTPFIESISQRTLSTSWCEKKPVGGVGTAGKNPCLGKYSAINVTNNTIEMRIFRSSLLPERVLKNIEFCHALVSWCRDTSIKALTPSNMADYIASNRKTYPNLSSFISDRIEA